MCPNPQEAADLVTFTEGILIRKTSFFVQRISQLLQLKKLQIKIQNTRKIERCYKQRIIKKKMVTLL